MKGVKYYVIADTENKTVDVFELINEKYVQKMDTIFYLTTACVIDFDVYSLWQLM
jgi:hypothetical protein